MGLWGRWQRFHDVCEKRKRRVRQRCHLWSYPGQSDAKEFEVGPYSDSTRLDGAGSSFQLVIVIKFLISLRPCLKPLSQTHANRPHILTYWKLCAGGVGVGWAGRVAIRTGCPDSIPAICLWPLALVKNCQFPPLGLLFHFWSKKEKNNNPCSFLPNQSPCFIPNYYL